MCAYIYFIASQIGGPGGIVQCVTSNNGIDDDCSDGHEVDKWWFLLICCAIYIPLVMVRKIDIFAATHIFGDIMIIVTVIVICIYAGINVSDKGWDTKGVVFLNGALWPEPIGFSVYAFEGIGVILPIMEITENKKDYFKVLVVTCCVIGLIYVGFAEYCVFGFGANNLTEPLITASLPPKSIVTYIVKILYSLNLVFTYPLVIHPANLVLESYLFGSWPKSRKR